MENLLNDMRKIEKKYFKEGWFLYFSVNQKNGLTIF